MRRVNDCSGRTLPGPGVSSAEATFNIVSGGFAEAMTS